MGVRTPPQTGLYLLPPRSGGVQEKFAIEGSPLWLLGSPLPVEKVPKRRTKPLQSARNLTFFPIKTQFFFPRVAHVYLLLPLNVNRFITKYFPIKTLLKMMDSSVKNLGEFEYDNQNCLRHQKYPSLAEKFQVRSTYNCPVRNLVHNKTFPN